MGLVIAMFIIVAVYVGYHASQANEATEAHVKSIELESPNNMIKQTLQILQIKPELKIADL